jgi:hypothetical protein
MCLKAFALFTFVLLAAPRPFYFDKVIAPDGNERCCSKRYRQCFEDCGRTNGACAAKCLEDHCVAKACESHSETPPSSSEAPGTRDAEQASDKSGSRVRPMRADGKLTGPGTVTFEVFNRATDGRPLTVIGILYAKNEVLKKSGEHGVIPAESTRFTLDVSPEEFAKWSRLYGDITIAFSFPSEAEKSRWRYENLLTPRDQETTPAGEYRIRGAFHPLPTR